MSPSLSLLLLLTACEPDPEGAAADSGSAAEVDAPPTPADARLPSAMDGDRLGAHLAALQAIADDWDATRLAATSGYDDSASYVAQQLEAAGYAVTWQEFPYWLWLEQSPPLLEVQADPPLHLDPAQEFATFTYSPSGEAEGEVIPVDLVLPPGAENSSTSGCEAEDFVDFPAGRIALLQRGTCPFSTKAAMAQQAGAAAVILFNEGQADRQDVLLGTLGASTELRIPVLGASYALGAALAEAHEAGPVQARVVVDALSEERPTWNLWADLPGSPTLDAGGEVVVIGAHLDSVLAGPGINDNGSGTAVVLELALQAAALDLHRDRTLRFAFWGAEEAGLYGSFEYVEQLSSSELDQHRANLNFDMVGSPNGARFVYDGDDSDDLGGWPPPVGSDAIEALFTTWLDHEGLSWQGTAFDGRSDYGPFIYQGIPAGGLFTGAEDLKSESEADRDGGAAGEAYDPCYHQACDTLDNVDPVLLLEMARAAAWATERIAWQDDAATARTPLAGQPSPLRRHPGPSCGPVER